MTAPALPFERLADLAAGLVAFLAAQGLFYAHARSLYGWVEDLAREGGPGQTSHGWSRTFRHPRTRDALAIAFALLLAWLAFAPVLRP